MTLSFPVAALTGAALDNLVLRQAPEIKRRRPGLTGGVLIAVLLEEMITEARGNRT